jgi:outer membrane protein assembly factor BamB
VTRRLRGDGQSEPARRGWAAAARRALFAAVLLAAVSSGLWLGASAGSAHAEPMWTTYHRDAGRSGNDPDGIDPIPPELSWQSVDLGAPIWSQPLVVGSRVYVATVGDELYALEASTGKVIWQTSAGTPMPANKTTCGGDIKPTVGIVGTPVIDPARNTLYAVADTWNAATEEAHHMLEGFNLSTGERVLSTPVDPPGANPRTMLERPALNLANGNVVFGFGGNSGDCGLYNGAVGSAPEAGGPASFWQYSPMAPATGGAAVWAPSGAAVDSEGHVYIGTGNPNPKGQQFTTYDYSDSLLELSPSTMNLIGHFEPATWRSNSENDEDLGSAGPELLPGGLLFQAGKNLNGYLIETAGMTAGTPAVYSQQVCETLKEAGEGSFGGDAYAAGTIYVPCVDGVRALSYNQTARTFSTLWHGPAEATGPPIVSSGTVWSLATGAFLKGGGEKLYGLDPTTGLARYTLTLPSRLVDHFASPSAAGGRLFVATGSTVTAYQVAHLPPEALTEAASDVAQTTAALHASANPDGATVSECVLEWGTTATYGSSVPCTPLPAGKSPVAVSASLTGLAANTVYHYRVHVKTAAGEAYGSDETLKTALPSAPEVATGSASAVTETSAVLGATVNPNGAPSEDCHFDYGTTTSYGLSATCTPSPGAASASVPVAAAISGLSAGSTYYFRVVASNAGGTSHGTGGTFSTPSMAVVQTMTSTMGNGSLDVLATIERKPPTAGLAGTSLTVGAGGKLAVRVSCPASAGTCTGTIMLRSLHAVSTGHRSAILVLAVGSFALPEGHVATVKLRLSSAARKLLARTSPLRARATILAHDGYGQQQTTLATVTIRRAKRR